MNLFDWIKNSISTCAIAAALLLTAAVAEAQENRHIYAYASFETFPDGNPILDGVEIDEARGVDKNPYYKHSLRFLADGAYLIASFMIEEMPASALLRVVHLSSASADARNGGWAPITISINDWAVVENHSPSSHGYMTEGWPVGDFLRKGRNTIEFYFDNSQTHYWLQSFQIDGQSPVEQEAASSVCGPEEGQPWIVNLGGGVSMEFVPISAGSFMMGSENGESDERPVHRMTLPKPFWMAKTEVSQAQWRQVMGNNPSSFEGAQNPVETVSWYDAVEFWAGVSPII